jgi:hypothetical protein
MYVRFLANKRTSQFSTIASREKIFIWKQKVHASIEELVFSWQIDGFSMLALHLFYVSNPSFVQLAHWPLIWKKSNEICLWVLVSVLSCSVENVGTHVWEYWQWRWGMLIPSWSRRGGTTPCEFHPDVRLGNIRMISARLFFQLRQNQYFWWQIVIYCDDRETPIPSPGNCNE